MESFDYQVKPMNSPMPDRSGFYRCDICNSEVFVHYFGHHLGFYVFYYYCDLCEATFSWGGTIPIPVIRTIERVY